MTLDCFNRRRTKRRSQGSFLFLLFNGRRVKTTESLRPSTRHASRKCSEIHKVFPALFVWPAARNPRRSFRAFHAPAVVAFPGNLLPPCFVIRSGKYTKYSHASAASPDEKIRAARFGSLVQKQDRFLPFSARHALRKCSEIHKASLCFSTPVRVVLVLRVPLCTSLRAGDRCHRLAIRLPLQGAASPTPRRGAHPSRQRT